MKSYKAFLLASAVVTMVLPLSLSAKSMSKKEFAHHLAYKLQVNRSCPAPLIVSVAQEKASSSPYPARDLAYLK